ncbi:Transcription elongation factor SPT5 [Rhizophlyctis rosea]|nr:Transcription elongation factor SPT5 [Rhizophlyctis rosea]
MEVEIVPGASGLSFRSGTYDHKRAVVMPAVDESGSPLCDDTTGLQEPALFGRAADPFCTVRVGETEEQISPPVSNLRMVEPQKGDLIVVTSGEHRGMTGRLLSIDESDGVLKLDGKTELKIIALNELAKRAEEEL